MSESTRTVQQKNVLHLITGPGVGHSHYSASYVCGEVLTYVEAGKSIQRLNPEVLAFCNRGLINGDRSLQSETKPRPK